MGSQVAAVATAEPVPCAMKIMETLTNKLPRIHLAVLAAILLAGCQPENKSHSTVTVDQQRPEPAPAVVSDRDSSITLFGGLPGRGEITYEGRSHGSMLQHSVTYEGGDFDPDLDATGERIVFASTRHSDQPDIYIKSVDHTAVTQITSDQSADIQPAFSPDNQRIAFASNRTGNWDIWIVNIDGQHAIQVTNTPMDEFHPSWSTDGRRIVYSALPPGSRQWELWMSPAAANASSTFIGYGVFPEWSPEEDKIVYQRARERGSRWYSIWTLRLVDGEPFYPTEVAYSPDYALVTPSWSRDGRYIAYASIAEPSPNHANPPTSDHASDIWVIDANGGQRSRLTDGHTANFSPTWGPDDRVYFTSKRSGAENIWSIKPTTGEEPSRSVASQMPGRSSVITTGASATPADIQEKNFGD